MQNKAMFALDGIISQFSSVLFQYCVLCFRNNFVQVDIFYQELSYEIIEQQKAFEFLSLLSEIGGFLGLLLGASVLTVCELLDYFVMIMVAKLMNGNRLKNKTLPGKIAVSEMQFIQREIHK